ncbi:PqiC family protein [Methylocaldum sp.]|uniref:PqiC family protein n=1 Tax=Methylocaldum sp. TaxID=1969727 RepID=UPI002D2205C4|nr:PqiC family protein [Methylocaldum sp.]HYE35610.1 PqiC family protein [Methylocaldum sp.]
MTRFLWMTLFAGLFAGCGGSAPARFYTLMPTNDPATARGTLSDSTEVIVVGPVTIPAALDQPQLVITKGEHEVEVLEQHRWAAPFKDEITSALAARLSRLLGNATVAAYLQSGSLDPDVRILVDISRFELRPGDGGAFEALWTIKSNDERTARRGHTKLSIPAAGEDYAELVTAQSRALDAMAQDLAAALRAR